MARYRVTIEALGLTEAVEFEADDANEAALAGRDIFFTVCNYGVSLVDDDTGKDGGGQ